MSLKVMLVGGDFRKGCRTTGYVKAVRRLASELAEGNEVTVIPFLPQRPQLMADKGWDGAKVLSRRPSVRVMAGTFLGWPDAWDRIVPYLGMYQDRSFAARARTHLKYSLAYSFNRAFFRSALRKVMPEVVHVHGVNVQTLPFLDELLSDDVPFVTTCHGLYSCDRSSFAEADGTLEEETLRALGRDGSIITAVSKRLADELQGHFQIPIDALRVVHNGVDPMNIAQDRSLLRRKHGIPYDRSVVLTVGTVGRRKNQRAVLEALQVMTPEERGRFIFLVVGGGDTDELRKEASSMGLDGCVTVKGKISDDVLGEMYALSDVLSLTSTSEGFALVTLEALSAGLPIVTYAGLQGVDELGTTYGIVTVTSREPSALARVLLETSGRSWDREAIRKGAERFSWEHACSDYLSIYREAMRRSRSSER